MFTKYQNNKANYWSSQRKIQISKTHWHDFYEVESVIGGEATEFINGIPYNIDNGFITIMPPGAFHSYSVKSNFLHLNTFCFSTVMLSPEIKNKLSVLDSPHLFKLNSHQYEVFNSSFLKLNSIIDKSRFQYDIMRRIIEIGLLFCEQAENLYINNESDNKQIQLVQTVLNYIDNHYAEEISRNTLAEELHYSPSYFSTLFKKISGISLSEHITAVRMQHAMDLTQNSELPISKIIENVGYKSPSLFYETFQSFFGSTPKEIRSASKAAEIHF